MTFVGLVFVFVGVGCFLIAVNARRLAAVVSRQNESEAKARLDAQRETPPSPGGR